MFLTFCILMLIITYTNLKLNRKVELFHCYMDTDTVDHESEKWISAEDKDSQILRDVLFSKVDIFFFKFLIYF